MKAYRVKLIGTTDHYLVTERQKQDLDKLIDGNGNMVHIAGDTIRTNAIKAITQTNVDLESCPDYFIEAVKKEEGGKPSASGPAYRNLPAEWIILSEDGKILSTNISRMAQRRIAKAIGATGHFYLAKCHYRLGNEGKEYITNLTMIAEALQVKPDAEEPEYSAITQRFLYGVPQL